MLPEAERRGYNNVFAAFSAIIKNEVKLITKILSSNIATKLGDCFEKQGQQALGLFTRSGMNHVGCCS